jgi:chaperone required for assembly of F1-ATPase
MEAVRADLLAFAASDLVCYRAEGPEALVRLQDEHWSPLVAWLEDAFGVRLRLAVGVMHVGQDAGIAARLGEAIADLDAFALAALHTITTLTGSAVLALAVAHGRLGAGQAWAAAHVDENWQIAQWGEDAEAARRRTARWREMEAAALILKARG